MYKLHKFRSTGTPHQANTQNTRHLHKKYLNQTRCHARSFGNNNANRGIQNYLLSLLHLRQFTKKLFFKVWMKKPFCLMTSSCSKTIVKGIPSVVMPILDKMGMIQSGRDGAR